MHDDFAQRRRLALAVAITAILVPAAVLLNRGGDDGPVEPTSTLVGAAQIPGQTDDAGQSSATGSDGPADTDPMGTTPPEFIEGTVPPQANDPATIAIPRVGQTVRGSATFSRSISDPAACQVRDIATIPFASTITVRNLDNSRSVKCVADVGGVPPDDEVVLNADAFLQIGDLTDAPLSVEISW